MIRMIKRYGLIPNLPDHRDELYAAPLVMLCPLPEKVDLRAMWPDM